MPASSFRERGPLELSCSCGRAARFAPSVGATTPFPRTWNRFANQARGASIDQLFHAPI